MGAHLRAGRASVSGSDRPGRGRITQRFGTYCHRRSVRRGRPGLPESNRVGEIKEGVICSWTRQDGGQPLMLRKSPVSQGFRVCVCVISIYFPAAFGPNGPLQLPSFLRPIVASRLGFPSELRWGSERSERMIEQIYDTHGNP